MNIKSLLLGSAAALVTVSGARAADAVVVAEPEPVEYVRVCDVYGSGFYYMPGTETCLKVSGYMRYDIGAGDLNGIMDARDKRDAWIDGVTDFNDTYKKKARFALRVDARSETELGTLRGYAQINFTYANSTVGSVDIDGDGTDDITATKITTDGSTSSDINHAYIELGGFRVGKTNSLFTTFTGYAGGVINDDAVGYGPFDTHQIAYTYTGGNGFTAAVALEDGGSGPVYALDSYVPDVVGGVGYTAGWGGVSAVAGYNSVWEEWAGKVRLDVKASEIISAFVMAGLKSDDNGEPNFYGNWGGDWAVWGGATWHVTPKAALNAQLSYDEAENFAAAANVEYELVPGLTITPEVDYKDNFDGDHDSQWGGWLRFQRNF